MEFDIALFALVTLGLFLNAGMFQEVRDAWAVQDTRLAGVAAALGMTIVAIQVSTIEGPPRYLAPALAMGAYGVFWASFQLSNATHVVQLSRLRAAAPGGENSLLPLRLAVSAVLGASAVLLACGFLHESTEPIEPVRKPRSAASEDRPAPARGLEAQPVLNGAPVVGEEFVVPAWERSPVREARAGLDSAATTGQSDEAHDQE